MLVVSSLSPFCTLLGPSLKNNAAPLQSGTFYLNQHTQHNFSWLWRNDSFFNNCGRKNGLKIQPERNKTRAPALTMDKDQLQIDFKKKNLNITPVQREYLLCCTDASPINYGLWLRQEIEVGHPGESKCLGRAAQEDVRRCMHGT